MLQADADVEAPGQIRLHAIELFILRLSSKESGTFDPFGEHYRVFMRIKAGKGNGWGEIFLNEGHRPADWVVWASWYERFLHRSFKSQASLQEDILRSVDPLHLSRAQLLCDALQGAGQAEDRSSITGKGGSGPLFRLAEAYVSLF